jgi:hypothetical protein
MLAARAATRALSLVSPSGCAAHLLAALDAALAKMKQAPRASLVQDGCARSLGRALSTAPRYISLWPLHADPIFTSNKLPAGEVGYPGGIFDPLGYSKGAELASFKLKEIKNGRLAMLACLGFAVQSQTTGTGSPVDNLFTHMAAPWSTTVLSNQPDLFVWRWNWKSGELSET